MNCSPLLKNVHAIISLVIILPSFILSQATCPDGMISYWKFDEIGGVNFFIDSNGDNNASCNQGICATETPGILNRARSFNGSSEINITDNDVFDFDLNTGFTIEAWINTTEPGTGNKVFVGKYRGGSNMAWWLGYGDDNKAILSVRDSSGIIAQLEGTTEINDGEWHHIVGVRNRQLNVLQIYINGKKEGEMSTFFTGNFSGTSPLTIGYFANDYHYTGLLDEIAVYDIALTEDVINNHYEGILAHKDYCDSPTYIMDDLVNAKNFQLYQNYPNPFNPSTKIKFTLPGNSTNGLVTLRIYDLLGNEIATILNEEKSPGTYEVEFTTSESTLPMSSGIYFYKLRTGNLVQNKKMIYLK